MTSLAVVMATYEGARFIDDQLASIAAQSRLPDVLVISDDGSTDGTRERAERFAAEASFEVRVLDGPGEGLAENFRHGAQAADADLIAWSDQDDIWHPDKLRLCERALARGADFVSHSAQPVDEQLRTLRGRYPDYPRDRVRGPLEGDPWHVPSGFASVFRRELLQALDWERRPRSHQTGRPMHHDHAVSLAAFVSAPRAELRRPLALYRQHAGNAAGDPTPRGLAALRDARAAGRDQFERLSEIGLEQGAWAATVAGAHPDTELFFEAAARRARARAELRTPGHTRRAGVALLARARARGSYRAIEAGGFGARAAVNDLVAVALPAGEAR